VVGLGALSTPAALAPLWSKVIRSPGISPILRAILTNSSLTSLEDDKATIVSAPKFATGAPKWVVQMAELIGHHHGAKVEVHLRAAAGGEQITQPSADAKPAAGDTGDEPSDASRGDENEPSAPASRPPASGGSGSQPIEHPLVKRALEVFGGRIVDVQPRRRS